ncbi:MAG: CoA activase [Deltaproteobacteria bacterium]|nr:CoA activase [Deltaproteobacteria bacterium]
MVSQVDRRTGKEEYSPKYYLGVDVGSVSVNTVLIDRNREVLWDDYTRTHGQPLETALKVLSRLLSEYPAELISAPAVTGTAGKTLADLLGGVFINEIIVHAKAVSLFHPEARTIIEMGGEDSKLILVKPGELNELEIEDFVMNTMCAAGTGSFLDQQAHRLGFTIEEFSQLALKSERPPRIAGRCSVFAKTDMIHLQQEATPDFDIVAGLCFSMVRNLKSNIAKGKGIAVPVVFQGGVAANLGVRRAFREIMQLQESDLIIPKYFLSMGAIGAVLVNLETKAGVAPFPGLAQLESYLTRHRPEASRLPRLVIAQSRLVTTAVGEKDRVELPEDRVIDAYLGVDVGSISTNVVVIDAQRRVLSKQYLMTAGRPLEAVKEGLLRAGEELGDRVRILGVGTTGSGRYLTGDFIGADIARNEITAQATAAAAINPDVDTIFEIGGQDSKYISLKNGAIVDFMMNKVCAAGTGSFLEEQAEKLGISIKNEFGRLALSSAQPIRMGERCTVFMESDLVHHQQRGIPKEDLVAGLSYSIVQNYINKVVEDRKIGDNIFYQGATAANAGIVAAFEQVTGKKITVPDHHDVTGAIGVALLAMKERTWETSKFKGFQLSGTSYQITPFECKGCPNQCEIRQVNIQGERPLYYGSRCDKYDIDHKKKRFEHIPDLFAEREKHLIGPPPDTGRTYRRGRIGLPRAMFFHELMPFFRSFFDELDFEVIISDRTNKSIIQKGIEVMVTEPCFPIKVAHGHLRSLIDKGVTTIFLPSIINIKHQDQRIQQGVVCPYVQSLAYTVHSAIRFEASGVRLVQPVLHFGDGEKILKKGLYELGQQLGVDKGEINHAYLRGIKAQDDFNATLQERGRQILSQLKPDDVAMVVVSRPYNGCDPGINLGLPAKLKGLGIQAIPMDFLPLDEVGEDISFLHNMYWRYGQKILSAARHIKDDNRIYGLYITNFACGPDSFIQHFFREELGGKPYLEIEIDEHSADVGAITRLEAFLDSLKNVINAPAPKVKKALRLLTTKEPRRMFLPPMTDGSYAVAAAFQACGVEAVVLPDSDEDTLVLGRKLSSGKECYPLVLTTGDMAKMVNRPDFEPDRAAFFMPSGTGPCRFGQYHRYQRMVLDDLGYPNVPIFAPNQNEKFWDELGIIGNDFSRLGWQGVVAVDLLEKRLRGTRPYEAEPGTADKVYVECLDDICETIRTRSDIPTALTRSKDRFIRVPLNRNGGKPVIGLVGEIYTRANRFSNENIVREIERLGGEVWMPPISEWILYSNHTAIATAKKYNNYGSLLKLFLTNRVQSKDEHLLTRTFNGNMKNGKEPPITETIDRAASYLHPSFEGEAILSIGKSIDFISKGVCGLVNVIPFTCMPGTIVNALMKRLREDHNNIPYLNMAYDGQEQTNTRTRLEAFMYQVSRYKETSGN